MEERWVPVLGYEGFYEVSDMGNVRSLPRKVVDRLGRARNYPGKILTPTLNADGYRKVILSVEGSSKVLEIGRLVAKSFLGLNLDMRVDHRNRKRSDDRLVNLRWGTPQQNASNRTIPENNTSGVMGVQWYKRNRKWGANIVHQRERIFLGLFDSFGAAKKARRCAEIKYRGDFAPINAGG